MAFINNRLDFFDGESYGELQHASAFAKGVPSFVVQGLSLSGTTLSSGLFSNTGAFGQLGSQNESHTIPSNYTGFIVIKSVFNGRNSTSEILHSSTRLDSDPRTTSSERYFTIYQLSNGAVIEDYRNIHYIKSFTLESTGANTYRFVVNGFPSDELTIPTAEAGYEVHEEVPTVSSWYKIANGVGDSFDGDFRVEFYDLATGVVGAKCEFYASYTGGIADVVVKSSQLSGSTGVDSIHMAWYVDNTGLYIEIYSTGDGTEGVRTTIYRKNNMTYNFELSSTNHTPTVNLNNSNSAMFNTLQVDKLLSESDTLWVNAAGIKPNLNNYTDLGDATYQFKKLYLSDTTIGMADTRSAELITEIPDSVLDAWQEVNFKQFNRVGESERHFGLFAQHICGIFNTKGINPADYGIVQQSGEEGGAVYLISHDECQYLEMGLQRRETKRLQDAVKELQVLTQHLKNK